MTMPMTVAITVASVNRPLALEINSGLSSSGMLPGARARTWPLERRRCATVMNSNVMAISDVSWPQRIAATPTIMIMISASLQPTITERFGYLSAR